MTVIYSEVRLFELTWLLKQHLYMKDSIDVLAHLGIPCSCQLLEMGICNESCLI